MLKCQRLSIATQKPKIILALPSGRPLTGGKPAKRVMRFAQEFNQLVPAYEILISHSNCPRLSHALNHLVEQFRNDPLAEWFVWWNAKVEITPAELFAMVTAGKPVIGCLFTECSDPAEWQASFYPDVEAVQGVLPVPELDGGVKVFHRTVFDIIEKADPELSYVFDQSGRSLTAFFQERIVPAGEYRRLLAPAFFMDALCRKNGIGIFAAANVRPKHRGEDGLLYPIKEPYRPWEHKRLPPPVCAEDLPDAPADPRAIAVIIQYCAKDEMKADRLFLEMDELRFNSSYDISELFSDSEGYPRGPNQTALRLVRQNRDAGPDGYKAVLLLEPDCVPVTKDWLDQLSRDWDRCAAAGKLIMGSWHPVNSDHPTMGHINGCLMFSPDLAARITIPDVPPDKPWDTFLADVFQPVWARTGLIKNLNRHRTATTRQITEPECGTRPPVLIHGVKDDSVWNYAKQQCDTKSSSPAIEKTLSG